MKKVLSFLTLCLGLCIVSCYDDTAILERLDALESTTIASIKEQINAIKGSISDLEIMDKELDAAIAVIEKEDAERDKRIVALQDSITELQAADDAIGAEIESMGQTLLSLIEQDEQLKAEIEAIESSITELQTADANMQTEIEAMKQTLQNLEEQDEAILEQIAIIEKAIAELRAVDSSMQADIEAIKQGLKGLEERDARFETDIDSLKAYDIALDARIEELNAYVDSGLVTTKDWANATFSTLKQYEATCDEIAAIKVLISEQEASLMQAISDAVAASEESIKGWINEQLTGYWTIAETQAKLDTIKANTDEEIAALKNDLNAAKEDLTAAYRSEITKAIEDANGKLSAKIDEINAALEKKITDIETRLTVIEEKLNNLMREFAIKFDDTELSITDGGTTTVNYTITGATEKTIVKALGQNGWRAKVTQKSNDKGFITVTAPNPLTQDEIIVLVYDGEYRTIMSTLNFFKGFATPSQTVVEFGADADTVSIDLMSNIDCKVSIPVEAQSWLSVVESATRATKTETINFACTALAGGIRKATATFTDEYDVPISTMSFIQQGNALEVTLTEAGTLIDAVGKDVYQSIKGLIVNGPINGTDVICIRRMEKLEYLNLANADIVEGGEPYYNAYSTKNNIIGEYMFYNSLFLSKGGCDLVLPSKVDTISDNAFKNCDGLLSVTFPAELTYIGNYAFQNCTKLQSVIFPSQLLSVGDYAFNGCSDLSNVTCTPIMHSIGSHAFSNTKLTNILLPEGLIAIGSYAFSNTKLTNILFPEGMETIASYTFYNCNELADVTLPATLYSIQSHAFYNTDIKNIDLPNGLYVIGSDAFNCSSIKRITIPNTIRTIQDRAFNNNPIEEVYLEAFPDKFYYIGNTLFDESVYANGTLYIPQGTSKGYFTTDFGLFRNIIEKFAPKDSMDVIDGLDTITLKRSYENINGYKILEGSKVANDGLVSYSSEVYSFREPLKSIRFEVMETGSNALAGLYPFFTLSSFELYDKDGLEIELSEDDIKSNACHNTLNPGRPDGAGIAGLIDDDPNSYFHSTWEQPIYEYHNLEVSLPEGKYDAFSFSMAARSRSHVHQFPAVLKITPIFSTQKE